MDNNIATDPGQHQSVPQNSSHFSKTFIILIAVILVTVVGVGGYFLGVNQNQVAQNLPQPVIPITKPPPIPVDETADWKTYRNEKYSFELKYPPTKYPVDEKFYLKRNDDFEILFDKVEDGFKPEEIRGWTHPWPDFNIRISGALHSQGTLEKLNTAQSKKENLEIAGIKSTKISQTYYDQIIGWGDTKIIFNKDNYGWTISFPNKNSGIYDPVYDQILSTFKFTDQ